MSSTYNLEPPPTAKVLLQTTSGDIELEIFAKQTPLTSRNFLQHCLDGYYDDTIFHRLVPGFVLQGGDPTGTGDGGDSIYPDGPFADEFHSRLKFNRRGLLGMANTGRKDDNGSQFFITLGKTEELTGKNTMFGRVAGDTIYNVMKMGESELLDAPGSERPLYPTKITGAEVLLNPFPDMVKRVVKSTPVVEQDKGPAKKKDKKKGGKVLLSFGGDDGEEKLEPVAKKAKFNTNLVVADPSEEILRPPAASGEKKEKKGKTARKKAGTPPPSPPGPRVPETKAQLPLPDEEEPEHSDSSSPEPEQVKRVSSMLEKTNAQIAELKASMRRDVVPAPVESIRKKSALEEMIPETAVRGRKRKQGNRDAGSMDARALKMLDAFRAKLGNAAGEEAQRHSHEGGETAPDGKAETGQVAEDEEANLCDLHFIANCQSCREWSKDGADEEADDPTDKGWMSHALNFGKDTLGKDLNWKKQNDDGLVTIDSRDNNGNIKEDGRERRRDRDSGKTWARDRDSGRDGGRDGNRDRQRDRYSENRGGERNANNHRDRERDRDRRDRRQR